MPFLNRCQKKSCKRGSNEGRPRYARAVMVVVWRSPTVQHCTRLLSAASAWEISTKYRIGKLPEAGDIVRALPMYIRKARFTELGVSVDAGLLAGNLPGPHKDPFDRMLIAQARLNSLPILTIDPVFREYGVTVLW